MIWITGAVVFILAGLLLISLTADPATEESDANRAKPPEDENQ